MIRNHNLWLFYLKNKFKLEYRWIRMEFDATFLIVEYLLDGTVGLGPFIQACLLHGEKLII